MTRLQSSFLLCWGFGVYEERPGAFLCDQALNIIIGSQFLFLTTLMQVTTQIISVGIKLSLILRLELPACLQALLELEVAVTLLCPASLKDRGPTPACSGHHMLSLELISH